MRRSEAGVCTSETRNFVVAPAAALNADSPLARALCGGGEVEAIGGAVKACGSSGGGQESEMGESCRGGGGDEATEA